MCRSELGYLTHGARALLWDGPASFPPPPAVCLPNSLIMLPTTALPCLARARACGGGDRCHSSCPPLAACRAAAGGAVRLRSAGAWGGAGGLLARTSFLDSSAARRPRPPPLSAVSAPPSLRARTAATTDWPSAPAAPAPCHHHTCGVASLAPRQAATVIQPAPRPALPAVCTAGYIPACQGACARTRTEPLALPP